MNKNNRNPFLDHSDEEGSLPEKLNIRHALNKRSGEMPDIDREWQRFVERIGTNAGGKVDNDRKNARISVLSSKYFFWITSLAAAVVAGIIWYAVGSGPKEIDIPQGTEIFLAGKDIPQSVVVTSNSGEIIEITGASNLIDSPRLSRAYSESDSIVLETPAGQEMAVVLPDSSKVVLWANSKLVFPAKFSSDKRCVKLYGEACFDVQTDSLRPFVVETDYLTTRVYGTEFVVRAFARQDAAVVLIEGCVSVSDGSDSLEARLKPGDEASFGADEKINVAPTDIYPWIQRRDGMFYFDETTLFDILLELGRWFNVSVVSFNDNALSRKIHFVADRNSGLTEIISELNSLMPDYEISFDKTQLTVK